MTDSNQKTVATPSAAVKAMQEGVDMVRTLVAGTEAMRKKDRIYLPKNEAESDEAYRVRKARSVLFNATGKTVDDMAGKVFAKPIVLKDSVPAQLKAYAEDIDLAGTHFNVFASNALKDGMQAGVGYFLVDAPEPPAVSAGRVMTKAETDAAGIRPYLTYITVERLLGWKSERINGVETLTQIRFLECVTIADGDYHETEVDQVRVMERDKWRVFRKNDKGEWIQFGTDGVNRLGKITLAPFYTQRTGFMTGAPPLQRLAEKNVEHWQLDSDLGNITHVAQVPVMFLAGFKESDNLKIGASEALRSSDPTATVQYVEHTGAAINSGRDRLKDIEFQMQVMGLQLLVDKPGQTATGEVRDDVKENSPLAMMADALRDALELALGFMAEYEGLGADKGGEIDINKDFGVQAGAAVDVPNLLTAKRDGTLDHRTTIDELKRRGFLAESVDAEKVIARSKTEMANSLDAGPGRGMNLDGPPPPLGGAA